MASTPRAAHFENDAEWNAVWDEYDARGTTFTAADRRGAVTVRERDTGGDLATSRPLPLGGRRAARGACPRTGARRGRTGRVVGRAMVGTLTSAVMLVGLWAALPWLLAMRVTAALRSPDPVALTRQLEPVATAAGLREALLAEVPSGLDGGAGRWVADLAGRMAAAAGTGGGAAEWIALRATARDAAGLPRLEVLRDVRTLGPALFRLEYGPEGGAGGMRFDVAWQGGDFRVVGVRSLDAPPRELPRRWSGGPQVAMR